MLSSIQIVYIIGTILGVFIFVYILIKYKEAKMTFAGMGGHEKIITQKGWKKITLNFGVFKRKIIGLYKDNKSKKTILFFHGNAETLNEKVFLNYLEKSFSGYNILTFDYPGYGESKGFPRKKNTYKTSELFYDWLIKVKKIKAKNIVLWGYSVGTSIATELAYKKDFDALILISPFTSRYAMSKHKLGNLLPKIIPVRNSLKSVKKIKKIKNKTLIVHGTSDATVPYYMGKELFENSGSKNKQFITVPEGTHDLLLDYSKKLLKYYKKFLNSTYITDREIVVK